ncbi:HNH endonuclease [Archangium gephyra]|nr:HNH endonuclease [Archangium gephyra]
MLQCVLLGLFALSGAFEAHRLAPVPAEVLEVAAPSPGLPVEADDLGTSPTVDAIAGKDRTSLPFTKKGKSLVKDANAKQNDGKILCENCKVETVPGEKHVKDVSPPPNEAQVDHIIPKAKGGKGDPANGQVLCRDCNIKKSDKPK